MSEVTVTTGARLHFGPLAVAAPAGGKFGGVGVMIATPRIVLAACHAEFDEVCGDTIAVARVVEFRDQFRDTVTEIRVPRCKIIVREALAAHCGLGSGTQLGLAVARAMSILQGESGLELETLAYRVRRGLRSAIGLHGFNAGGFLVDGGRAAEKQFGTLVSRHDFPPEWRFVLAAPRTSQGLSGESEQHAFAAQPPMPTTLTAELCRIVLMDWLPAIIEADFGRCSESLYKFGHSVGEFFVPTQGGVFAHPRMRVWAELIRRRGIHGVAQTSWGPTLAVLCPNEAAAQQLRTDFQSETAWSDCTFDVATPLNRGASVVTS